MTSIVASITLVACTRTPESRCFEQREPPVLNALEAIVFDDAKARTAKECRAENRQCDIRLVRDTEGEFNVFVTYASVREDGECVFLIGDHELHVYGPAGDHRGRFPGM